jgi:hypothetical protein
MEHLYLIPQLGRENAALWRAAWNSSAAAYRPRIQDLGVKIISKLRRNGGVKSAMRPLECGHGRSWSGALYRQPMKIMKTLYYFFRAKSRRRCFAWFYSSR